MGLFSFVVPNLIQGVSQQADGQRDPTQGEIQVNGYSSAQEGLRKREGFRCLAKVSATPLPEALFHSILRDQEEKYLAVIAESGIRVFDLEGSEYTVRAPGGYGYLALQVGATPKRNYRAASLNDYTWIVNTTITPQMGGGLTPETPRPKPYEAVVWVKAANYGQDYYVKLNGTTAQVQTPMSAVIYDSSNNPTENRISTEQIAQGIIDGLAAETGVTMTRSGSVVWFQSDNPFSIGVSDARGDTDISLFLDTTQLFQELPQVAPNGYQIEVVGDPSNRNDNYFVEFVTDSGGNLGQGVWQECAGSGSEYQLLATSMPHVLVREADGNFYFGPVDGSTTANGTKIPSWGERRAGDFRSNPDPSFIGHPINDVFVYRNRLGFLADEFIVLSRSGEFFDFFSETVTTVLDSDPISLAASGDRVSVLRYAVPAQDELILFSDQTQFRFTSSAVVLTPAAASITVLTQYEIDVRVRPIQVGTSIMFAQANGEWTQFMAFQLRGSGTSISASAIPVSQQVSAYIPSGIFKLADDTASNSWYAISDLAGFQNRIYVNKYLWQAGRDGMQLVQNSWSFWQLNGADEVLQLLCLREELFLLVRYDSEVWLEKADISDAAPEGLLRPPDMLLDRRVSTELDTPAALRVAPGVYDPVAKTTTWTLPYTTAAETEAWTSFADENGGRLLATEGAGHTTMTAAGKWDTANVVFGERFDFVYRLTRFKLYRGEEGRRSASNLARTQVRKAKVRYHDSRYFEAHVLLERRDPAIYKWDGITLGVRNSVLGEESWDYQQNQDNLRFREGVFSIPVMSKGENAIIELRNPTAMPCKFTTVEWMGMVTQKARAMG